MKKQIKYKAKWKDFSHNKAFWKEVLVGRTIKKLNWDKKGLASLQLDSGERVYVSPGGANNLPTFAIIN